MIRLTWADGSMRSFHACVLALGGGSYASEDEPVLWPELLTSHGISCIPFEASNTGYTVPWKAAFLQEAEGKPLKNICLSNARGSRRGDLVVTEYGLEGTPIYFLGEPGPCLLDLKPDLSLLDVLARLQKGKENLSPIRRVQKFMNLCEASQSLLFHHAPDAARSDLTAMASVMKQFPLTLAVPRPLRESISSSGGVAWEELDERFMLRRLPNVYCIGEMIDWDAPTGGFLIQGCVSQGYSLAHHLPLPLESDPPSP
jgi:predicted flavoprotein YhiN